MPLLTPERVLAAYPLLRLLGFLPAPALYRAAWPASGLEYRWLERKTRQRRHDEIAPVIERFDLASRHIEPAVLVKRHVRYLYCQRKSELLTLLLLLSKPKRLECLLGIEVFHELRALLKGGRGAVLATLHIGPYGMLPPILAALGLPVSATALTSEFRAVEELGRRVAPALHAGLHRLPVEDATVLVKSAADLRRGRLVCIYPEFPIQTHVPTMEVNLFGRTVRAPLGAATLSASLNAPLVPLALASLGNGRFQVAMGSAILPSSSDRSEALRLTGYLFTQIEQFVSRFPEQWMGWDYYAQFPQHGPSANLEERITLSTDRSQSR